MENKPRKWWIAGLLSLLEPGLGQIYNGQWRKGLLFIPLSTLTIPLLMLPLDSKYILVYLFLGFLFELFCFVFVVGDAVIQARKSGSSYELKPYNRVAVYVGVVMACTISNASLKVMIRNDYSQAYSVPAGSMEPTLEIGDQILVDKRESARNPQRGHLVVFEYPKDPAKEFVKRVVAVGGDTVMIRDKILYINGEPSKEPYVVHREAGTVPAEENPRDNFGPVTVPVGCYFMLGDNRDSSYDSRFWGAVDKSKVKGTVKNIYWSWDRSKKEVRWDRIGRKTL